MSYRNHFDGDYNPFTDHPDIQQANNGNNGNNPNNNINNNQYHQNPYIDPQFSQMVQNYGQDANQSYLNQHSIPAHQHNGYNNNNNNHRGRSSNRGRGRGSGKGPRGRGKRYTTNSNVPPRHRNNRNYNHNYDEPKEENIYVTQGKDMSEIRKEMNEPSPPSQSPGGEIKENIDPVPEPDTNTNTNTNTDTSNESQSESIDIAALVANIAMDFKKEQEEKERRKEEKKAREKAARLAARRAAKQKKIQQQNMHQQSLMDINENDEEDYNDYYFDENELYEEDEDADEDLYEEDEDLYKQQECIEQFLAEQGLDIDEFDENGEPIGLVQEDDMDNSGMEKVTQENVDKLQKGETLMVMSEEENAWELWNLYDIDTVNGILCLRINGGDEERRVWSEDLKNEKLYRMIKDEEVNNTEDKANDNDDGDVSGFRKGWDYSNCMIKDTSSGLYWRVKEPYDIESAKALIVNIRTGESKEAFLNKMPHTLPFN